MKFSLNQYRKPAQTLMLGCAILCSGILSAQAQQPVEKEKIFTAVEHMPQFSGDLGKYLAENIRYPEPAKKEQIQGRVVLQFVIDKEGNVSHAVLQRDIGGGCGEEAMRVVKLMPKWTPGKQGGQPVNVYYTLPVSFKLAKEDKTVPESTLKTEPSAGQSSKVAGQSSKVFTSVEDMPQPSVDLGQYLAANLLYPEAARKAGVEGRVIAQFVIDEQGKIKDPVIQRGIHPDCDQEVLRVLYAMPNWKPGMQDGKAVSVYYTLPVSFRLDRQAAGKVTDAAAKLNTAAAQIIVSPNPATSEVVIDNKSSLKIKQVMVYNANGSLMFPSPVNGAARHRINTGKLLRGTYTLSIETDKGTITKKVILQ